VSLGKELTCPLCRTDWYGRTSGSAWPVPVVLLRRTCTEPRCQCGVDLGWVVTLQCFSAGRLQCCPCCRVSGSSRSYHEQLGSVAGRCDLSFMDRSGRAAGLDLSFPGPFVHGPFGPCRWPGPFVSWTFRSLDLSFMDRSGRAAGLDLSFPGPFVPWTFRSWTVRAVPVAAVAHNGVLGD
jgi:hypothetical protein